MMRNFVCTLMIGVLIILPNVGYTSDVSLAYQRAKKAAKAHQVDFAFMHFKSLLRDYPDSKYTQEALFAVGEYYFLLPKYDQAEIHFVQLIKQFPESKGNIFALGYLRKIKQLDGDTDAVSELTAKMIAIRQVSLIFEKYKEYTYTSPLNRAHRAVFHIDKIEFFVEGELIEKVSY